MVSRVRFSIVDVFADAPLRGNPLPLVPDAGGLDEPQMRAIAREFNQSETTFLVPPTLPGATVRLRSFTPIGVGGGPRRTGRGCTARLAGSGRRRGLLRVQHRPGREWRRRVRIGGSGLIVADGTLTVR